MKEWYEESGSLYWYDQYAQSESATAFVKYDPERIVGELLSVDADIYAIYAANQYSIAYYPSKILPQHPGLKGRDYIGDIVPLLRRHGKRVIVYVNWLESKHPEWCIRPLREDDTIGPPPPEYPLVSWADPTRPEGRVRAVPGGKWEFPCMNSPKYAQILDVADELAANYKFDAFSLDMFTPLAVCVCPYCGPHLQRILGTARPTWAQIRARWREYVQWRQDLSAKHIREIQARLHARQPGIVGYHNAHSPLRLLPVAGVGAQWLPHVGVYFSECTFEGPFCDTNTFESLLVKHHKATGKPSSVVLTSTAPGFDHSPISKAKALVSAAVAKANGCEVFGLCGVGARQDTTSDKTLLKLAKETFAFWRQCPDLSAYTSVASVAVLFSWRDYAYYEPSLNQYPAEFMGWCRRLFEEHIPFNVEIAEEVTAERLCEYPLVILPNITCTDETLDGRIRAFVRAGGAIIASGETSRYDADGREKKDFSLADVLGVSYEGKYPATAFHVETGDEPIAGHGLALQVRGEAATLARLVTADIDAVAGGLDPLPLATTQWPLHTSHAYGLGKAWCVPWSPGRFYMQSGYWKIAAWLSNVIDTALGVRLFTTNAPSTVEISCWQGREGERRLIFANKTMPQHYSSWGVPNEEDEIIALSNIDVEVAMTPGRKVRPHAPNRNVTFHQKSGKLSINVARLEYLEVVDF